MAKRVVNRKALREEADAAEAAGKTKKKAKRKTTTKRKSSKKGAADGRKKLYWGVFNQSLKRVEMFDFNQKKEAQERAETLNKSGKSQYFVQKVKELIDEA